MKNAARSAALFLTRNSLSLLAVLALLVGGAAAGLAGGLAGSLALAAAAVGSAGAKVPGLQADDMFPFHGFILQKNMILYTIDHTSSQALNIVSDNRYSDTGPCLPLKTEPG